MFFPTKIWNQPNLSLFDVPCCIAAQKCGDAPNDNRNIGNLRIASELATPALKDFAMPSHVDYPVVVITGASSGIGRATAHAFAKQGASVVLAARRVDMLREVERECLDLGGDALVVQTDTTQEDQVENLAAQALNRFGRIDVWFNNAGVGVFGRFEDIPSDVWRRVIETNVFGYVSMAPRPRCVSSAPRVMA
jgi:hypothetical protein